VSCAAASSFIRAAAKSIVAGGAAEAALLSQESTSTPAVVSLHISSSGHPSQRPEASAAEKGKTAQASVMNKKAEIDLNICFMVGSSGFCNGLLSYILLSYILFVYTFIFGTFCFIERQQADDLYMSFGRCRF
jgi:hypothetical protein